MMNVSSIQKVYSGKMGCMCGCLGKYSYTEGQGQEAWQGKTNERTVRILAKKILLDPRVEWQDNIAFIDDEEKGTTKAIYFKEGSSFFPK